MRGTTDVQSVAPIINERTSSPFYEFVVTRRFESHRPLAADGGMGALTGHYLRLFDSILTDLCNPAARTSEDVTKSLAVFIESGNRYATPVGVLPA